MSPFLGYTLGQLYTWGFVSADQHDAGVWFCGVWRRYHQHHTGIRLPRVTAHFAEMVTDGQPAEMLREDWRDEHERAVDARERYDAVQEGLADRGIHYDGNRILTQVCVLDRVPHENDLGMLRKALTIVGEQRERGVDGRRKSLQNHATS